MVISAVQAEPRRFEGLQQRDASAHRRSLLQPTPIVEATLAIPEEDIPAWAAPSEAAMQDSPPSAAAAAGRAKAHESSSRKERVLKGGGGGGSASLPLISIVALLCHSCAFVALAAL